MTGFVMVGVDGSRQALHAVGWGADEAQRRALPLRIVHIAMPWGYDPQAPQLEAAGLRLLQEARRHAETMAPGARVTTRLGIGPTATALAEETAGAVLMILATGAEGAQATDTEATGADLPGPVIWHAVEHSSCPVVVVPPDGDLRPRRHEVVVGVDGSEDCLAAIDFAFDEASRRGIGVRAVHAWTHTASPPGMRPDGYDEAAIKQEGTRVLAEALAGWPGKFPDVPVIEQVLHADPVDVLSSESRTADLVVIGSCGRGQRAGTYLGSVSHDVLRHAQGPIVIVRPSQP